MEVTRAGSPEQLPGSAGKSVSHDVQLLLDTIESVQQPIEDFQCEFEGSVRFEGKGVGKQKLMEGGVLDEFSGVFIWKRNGDTYCDTLHRMAPDGTIRGMTLSIRAEEGRAETYQNLTDGAISVGEVKDARNVSQLTSNQFAYIFPIDQIKRDVVTDGFQARVVDEVIDGRALKVLEIALATPSDVVLRRYWIDLNRTGQVVRVDMYGGRSISTRLDIELAPFRVGAQEIWMPVSGVSVGYGALVDKNPVVLSEPTSRAVIAVVMGTMVFNQHPGPDVFTIKYRPGTPISDNLRAMRYQFGRQKLPAEPTKVEMEAMLRGALAEAEKQKNELAAAPTEGINWLPWLPWTFGAAAVISVVALIVQRRVR